MTEIVDTHCHLYFDDFSYDLDQVIERANEEKISSFIVPGVDLDTSMKAIQLAERYPNIYAGIGIHPNSSDLGQDIQLRELEKLLPHPKVVAIGEIGLDYYRNYNPAILQKDFLIKQLVLAENYQLPVIIHNRNAFEDLVSIVSYWKSSSNDSDDCYQYNKPLGVFHSFSEDWVSAQKIINLGFIVGISGVVTYPKATTTHEVVSRLPLSNLIIETDAPFLPPQPYRGKRNEPKYLSITIAKIAELRDLDVTKIIDKTTENAITLFGMS